MFVCCNFVMSKAVIISIKKKTIINIFYCFLGLFVLFFLIWLIPTGDDGSRLEDNREDINESNESGEVIEEISDNFYNIEHLHWGHLPITYKFENKATDRQINLTRLAFKKIEEETSGVVRFIEVTEDPDISIYFRPVVYQINEEYVFARTKADARFTEVDESRNLIVKGEINFYGQGFVCNTGYPALEVHEILHLFDIPHNPLVDSIMSPYTSESSSTCEITEIDDEYISCLRWIYSNGEIEGSCDFPNVIKEADEEYEPVCELGWYPVNGTDYCCPEPGMVIVEGYCQY